MKFIVHVSLMLNGVFSLDTEEDRLSTNVLKQDHFATIQSIEKDVDPEELKRVTEDNDYKLVAMLNLVSQYREQLLEELKKREVVMVTGEEFTGAPPPGKN